MCEAIEYESYLQGNKNFEISYHFKGLSFADLCID